MPRAGRPRPRARAAPFERVDDALVAFHARFVAADGTADCDSRTVIESCPDGWSVHGPPAVTRAGRRVSHRPGSRLAPGAARRGRLHGPPRSHQARPRDRSRGWLCHLRPGPRRRRRRRPAGCLRRRRLAGRRRRRAQLRPVVVTGHFQRDLYRDEGGTGAERRIGGRRRRDPPLRPRARGHPSRVSPQPRRVLRAGDAMDRASFLASSRYIFWLAGDLAIQAQIHGHLSVDVPGVARRNAMILARVEGPMKVGAEATDCSRVWSVCCSGSRRRSRTNRPAL